MMIISAWWLQTGSKFSGQEFEEIYRNIGSLKTLKQARIAPLRSSHYCAMNEKVLGRNSFVKYLGVYIDEKLTWSVHINKFFLQSAKHNAM